MLKDLSLAYEIPKTQEEIVKHHYTSNDIKFLTNAARWYRRSMDVPQHYEKFLTDMMPKICDMFGYDCDVDKLLKDYKYEYESRKRCRK